VAHLLLIEDDAPLRGIIALSLRALQHDVTEAETGRQGLKRFKENPADLVITDLVMPEEDGLGVLNELRRVSPHTPIIVISGGLERSPLYRELATKLGATQVLAKPFHPAELQAAVAAALATQSG
jgi:DNA-binding response OmpR family regulator